MRNLIGGIKKPQVRLRAHLELRQQSGEGWAEEWTESKIESKIESERWREGELEPE